MPSTVKIAQDQHNRRAKSRFGLVKPQEAKISHVCEVVGLIADNLKKAGRSWGYIVSIDSKGRFSLLVHTADRKRFVVRADEKLTAFLELERVTREIAPRESPAIS